MDKLAGSMETLSSLQFTSDMEGLDAQSKIILHSKDVLAVILQGTIREYQGYSRQEIIDFIESDTIREDTEVSTGRTNSIIQGDNVEFTQLNEKTTLFDIIFKSKNPLLSDEKVLISLHINIEPQKDYALPYPLEKRGIYYLARELSSQLSLITDNTDYGKLEKCYSIWICRDNIPKDERYSISVYEFGTTQNTGGSMTPKENYDLMTLVVIKLGNKVYNGEKKDTDYDLLRFLNAIMYPHKDDFMETISEYIDFSENEELWKEESHMFGLGQSIFEEGIETGIEQGIRAIVLDNIEEQIPREKSISKLQKLFDLTKEKAEQYYEKYACKV